MITNMSENNNHKKKRVLLKKTKNPRDYCYKIESLKKIFFKKRL